LIRPKLAGVKFSTFDSKKNMASVVPGATTTRKINIIGLYIDGNLRYLTARFQFCFAYSHVPAVNSTFRSKQIKADSKFNDGKTEVTKNSY